MDSKRRLKHAQIGRAESVLGRHVRACWEREYSRPFYFLGIGEAAHLRSTPNMNMVRRLLHTLETRKHGDQIVVARKHSLDYWPNSRAMWETRRAILLRLLLWFERERRSQDLLSVTQTPSQNVTQP